MADYSAASFESESKTSKTTSAPPPVKLQPQPREPLSPRKSPLKSQQQQPLQRKNSESESEDSFSVSHSETASDQSDVEGRIRALSEELVRRKAEADRLKREHKKRQRDALKVKEQSLKKQIEVRFLHCYVFRSMTS